jgi:hypothetical protein
MSQYGKWNPPEQTFRNARRDYEPGLSLQRGELTAGEAASMVLTLTPAVVAAARVRHALAGTLRDPKFGPRNARFGVLHTPTAASFTHCTAVLLRSDGTLDDESPWDNAIRSAFDSCFTVKS